MQSLIRRLHHGQDGTALTEFVITLPIFVLTFSFMWALYMKTHELNRIRYPTRAPFKIAEHRTHIHIMVPTCCSRAQRSPSP